MMAPVTHSYIWNRYAAKTLFASLTKIERKEIIISIEYSIIYLLLFSLTSYNIKNHACISAQCINNSNILVFQEQAPIHSG